MTASRILYTSFALTLAASSSALAQTPASHIVDRTAIEQALAGRVLSEQEQRDTVLRVLGRAETQKVADRFGLSLTQMTAAVGTMSASELASIAEPAARAEAAYVGGDVIVISVTTLLLVLLVVILIVK